MLKKFNTLSSYKTKQKKEVLATSTLCQDFGTASAASVPMTQFMLIAQTHAVVGNMAPATSAMVGDMGCPQPRYELPSLLTLINSNRFNAVQVASYTNSSYGGYKAVCGGTATKLALPKGGRANVNLDASAKTLSMEWSAPDLQGGWHHVISAPLFEQGRNQDAFLCETPSGWPKDYTLTLEVSPDVFPGPRSRFCDNDKHCITLPGTTCVSCTDYSCSTTVPANGSTYGFCCDASNCTGTVPSASASRVAADSRPLVAAALISPPSPFPAKQCDGFPAPAKTCAPNGPLGPSFYIEIASKGVYYVGGVSRLPCNGFAGQAWVAVQKLADVSSYDESIIAATIQSPWTVPFMVSIVKTSTGEFFYVPLHFTRIIAHSLTRSP